MPGLQRPTIAVAILAIGLLGGCKVMSVDRAEAIRARISGDFDATGEVARTWSDRVMPFLRKRSVPLTIVMSKPLVGRKVGRQAGDGSPWTVVVRGDGIVQSVEHEGPVGRVVVALPDRGSTILQTGPLVSGTAIRDALPFVRFDDVPDQIAFADLGAALTRRALADMQPVVRTIKPGTRIAFLAVGPMAPDGRLPLLTPVTVQLGNGS